jgi:hypothetical protein
MRYFYKSNVFCTIIVHTLYNKADLKIIFIFFFSKKLKKVCTIIMKIIFIFALLYKMCIIVMQKINVWLYTLIHYCLCGLIM